MTKNDVLYATTHEWIHIKDKQATIGISSYAAMHLGDIVFFDLPKVGAKFKQGDSFAAVESVKSASDIYIPVSGLVVAVNDQLVDHPELVNEDPFENWIAKIEISDPNELKTLLDVDAYEATL